MKNLLKIMTLVGGMAVAYKVGELVGCIKMVTEPTYYKFMDAIGKAVIRRSENKEKETEEESEVIDDENITEESEDEEA